MGDLMRTSAGVLQKRRTRKNGWTESKRRLFLDTLAATGNVTLSVAATGMGRSSAQQLRMRDAEFARLWEEAREEAYGRLEDELLARTLGTGTDPDNGAGEGAGNGAGEGGSERAAVPGAVPFDPQVALALLRLRGARPKIGKRAAAVATQAEVDAMLMARLDALGGRLDATVPDAEWTDVPR